MIVRALTALKNSTPAASSGPGAVAVDSDVSSAVCDAAGASANTAPASRRLRASTHASPSRNVWRSAAEASAITASMNWLTLAPAAPAVSVCGMISSASATTVRFCAGVRALGVQAAAAAWAW